MDRSFIRDKADTSNSEVCKEILFMNNRSLRIFFIVFTASGFAGLIYESIWTHYLKLFLGHAAYAQALVLAVFMGGMALGSLICAKYSERISNLLIGYAVVEVVIGICAVLFHPLYVQFIDLAYAHVIPALGSPLAVAVFKWVAASLLILPQSIMLGMTFPLMTAGLIRRFPLSSGSIIAMLYFTNSMGAAIGVLAAGFLFIGWVGLPGTIVIAGFINIVIAAVIWLENKQNITDQREKQHPFTRDAAHPVVYRVFLLIALLTGLSSFIYEIGWIRMLSLVLGSSTHAFELMLSAFIMGIAFGGLWIKRRIDAINDPERFLAIVQVAMGILALATLPLYGRTFNVMAWLIRNLPGTEMGYMLFNLSSHGIAMIIMLPAAFCAGMTLPLITTTLLRKGTGERSIGAVYGFNTVGSIMGVVLAIHLAMPLLGLKGMLILGAGIDIALGVGLIWWISPSWRLPVAYALASLAVLLPSIFWLQLDPNKMASGVYRYGALFDQTKEETLFHRDGKSATVSIVKGKKITSIRTNGKPDAGIQHTGSGYAEDEVTMVLTGSIGTILHPKASTAAIIGWGSGLTTHVLLTSPNIKSIETIEIEPEMVQAAKLFGARVHLAYDDPRNHIQIEDAKSYFSFHKKKYDLIISEPSNPWVSGVSGLFSKEFFSHVREYLNEDGLLIQWLHLYEIDTQLIASIMNALAPTFSDYVIYGANAADILIVASPRGTVGNPDAAFLSMQDLLIELRRIEVRSLEDINVRLIGNKKLLAPFFNSYPITTNSDYAPVVDLYAVRSRFFRLKTTELISSPESDRLPILEMLGKRSNDLISEKVTYSLFPKSQKVHFANMIYSYLVQNKWIWDHSENPLTEENVKSAILAKQILTKECSEDLLRQEWWKVMLNTTANLVPYLSSEQFAGIMRLMEAPSCAKHFSDHQRDFILLIKAVERKDPMRMARHSENTLKQIGNNIVDADILEYILSAGMLGSLSSGNVQQARSLWSEYRHLLPPKNAQTISTRLLVSHLDSR